jgi:hypothetical protein
MFMTGTSDTSQRSKQWQGLAFAIVAVMFVISAALSVGTFHRVLAAANADTQVTVNANQTMGTLSNTSYGINTAVWDGHMLDSASLSAVKNAGVKVLRYPGGSTSDVYHWQSNSNNTSNNFDQFMNGVQSIGAQPIITIDYGSGTAQEAAGWVHYANKGGSGYNGPVPTYSGGSSTGHTYGIKYWEIGNEIYGNGTYGGSGWETDNHAHTPATYASNLVSYAQAMKAVDSSIKIGAVLTTPGNWPDGQTNSASPQPWNTTVLSNACSSVDFVIAHWYPQNPGSESDSSLLGDASQIANMASTLRSEINQYCGSHASAVQIMVTETNSVSSAPGKQTVSVVNALFLADDYMSWLEHGAINVDWWDLHNGANAGNNSSSLYGSANYGEYGVLANASCAGSACEPSANTPLPAYFGLQMLTKLGGPGDTMVSSSSSQSLVGVHAVKQSNGNLAVLLINKDRNNSHSVSLSLNGYSASNTTTLYSYSNGNSAISTSQSSGLTVQVPAYSLATVVLTPGSGGGGGGSTPTPTPTPGGGGSGYYKIINRNSGLALDISGASTANGGLAIQWPYSGANNQQWQEVSVNGGYKLVSRNSGLLLDDPGGSKTAGTQLDQWNDTNGSNQWWNLVSAGNGYYYIVNQSSGLYVDVNAASTANGATVIEWTSDGGTNQQWQVSAA